MTTPEPLPLSEQFERNPDRFERINAVHCERDRRFTIEWYRDRSSGRALFVTRGRRDSAGTIGWCPENESEAREMGPVFSMCPQCGHGALMWLEPIPRDTPSG